MQLSKMASSGKKRKREFQDENLITTETSHNLRTVCEIKKRRVSLNSKQPARKLFEDGALTDQITKELHSSKRFRVLNPPSQTATRTLTTSKAPNSASKLSTTGTFQRRASLIKLKKPLVNLTGTLKTKLAEQVKRSKMKGQQDYSQPISAVDSSLDHLRFLSTLQRQLNPEQCPEEDKKLEQQIDHEIRMRDGTAKLLAASKNATQLLEAAKNLHTSNARMLAYMSELQRRKTNEVLQRDDSTDGNQVPCGAKLSLSDLRIPLLWKEADHFKNKGDHRRYAVFCLIKIGTEIQDTTLLKNVDRTYTDLTFDDVIIFDNVRPDFECRLEVFCHRCQDDLSVASTPKRIRKKIEDFGNSVGRSVGKRLSGLKEDNDSATIIGPKFECIASGTLKLDDVDDCVGIFNLTLDTESNSMDLPLFGNFCCRLVAQPYCLIQDTVSGELYYQDPETLSWQPYWCRLRNLAISCWKKESDTGPPDIVIPVNKLTRTSEVPASLCQREHCIQIISDGARYNIAAADSEAKSKWWDGIYQHLLDQVMWLQACEQLMEIKSATPRRHSMYGKGMFTSLYDSIDDPASPMTRVLNRLNIPECPEDEEAQMEQSRKPSGGQKSFQMQSERSQPGEVMQKAGSGTQKTGQNVFQKTEHSLMETITTSSVSSIIADVVHESKVNKAASSNQTPPRDTETDSDTSLLEKDNTEDGSQVIADAEETLHAGEDANKARSPASLSAPQSDDADDSIRKEEESCSAVNHDQSAVTENMNSGEESGSQGVFNESETASIESMEMSTECCKKNMAETSWFQMMRQNEESCMDISAPPEHSTEENDLGGVQVNMAGVSLTKEGSNDSEAAEDEHCLDISGIQEHSQSCDSAVASRVTTPTGNESEENGDQGLSFNTESSAESSSVVASQVETKRCEQVEDSVCEPECDKIEPASSDTACGVESSGDKEQDLLLSAKEAISDKAMEGAEQDLVLPDDISDKGLKINEQNLEYLADMSDKNTDFYDSGKNETDKQCEAINDKFRDSDKEGGMDRDLSCDEHVSETDRNDENLEANNKSDKELVSDDKDDSKSIEADNKTSDENDEGLDPERCTHEGSEELDTSQHSDDCCKESLPCATADKDETKDETKATPEDGGGQKEDGSGELNTENKHGDTCHLVRSLSKETSV